MNAVTGDLSVSGSATGIGSAPVIAGAMKHVADKWAKTELKYLAHEIKKDAWRQILGGIVGTYGLIKQHEVIKEYLKLAQKQSDQAQEYLDLAKKNYNEISVPTFKCQKELFTRYQNQFSGFETKFITEAFRLCEYCPDYKLQEGRAAATVQAQFDRARRNKQRQTGKYNTGRVCHDATTFAIQTALARTAAMNHAYRYEEARKDKLDMWYFERKLKGMAMVSDMASRVVSGINGGASVATSGLGGVGSAVSIAQQAFEARAQGYGQLASFYGGVSNFGFSTTAYSMGRNAVSPYNGMNGGFMQAPAIGALPGGGSYGNALSIGDNYAGTTIGGSAVGIGG